MSYFIPSDVIYYNAFYAAKDVCDFLEEKDVLVFCSFIKEEIEKTFNTEEDWQCCHVFFDLSSDELFSPDEGVMARIADRILYYGEELTGKTMTIVNISLGFDGLLGTVERARSRFTEYLGNEIEKQQARNFDTLAVV